MQIQSPDGNAYEVGQLVGQTPTARLYLATQVGTGRSCLLQVAITAEHNGVLDRMAYVLEALRAKAEETERAYEPHRNFPDERLNYHFGFPELVESFLFVEQGNRRVNVLAFACADDAGQLVPLANIVEKDHLRVDLKTSAWIFGKALKLLAFAHENGFAMGRLDLSGVLIVPQEHFVVLFDWSEASTYAGRVPAEISRAEIAAAAQAIIILLGGDRMTRRFPDDGVPERDAYVQRLIELAAGSEASAERAHAEFYRLVDGLWEKGFHKFTTTNR